jgi:hypothetical protein
MSSTQQQQKIPSLFQQELISMRTNPFFKDILEFPAQFRALMNKGLILQLRQYKTNLIQLLFPIIIVGLILILQVLITVLIPSTESRELTPPAFPLAPFVFNFL